MKVEPTAIAGVSLLYWETASDERGSFARTFDAEALAGAGLPFTLVQANISRNRAARTLRGLHYQRAPHGEIKIVSCTRGRVFDVAVDVRPKSATYRRWVGVELSPEVATGLYLGHGIAHGFLTLEPDSELHYLMGAAYVPDAAAGLRWDDPALGIDWPADPLVISARDAGFAPRHGSGRSGPVPDDQCAGRAVSAAAARCGFRPDVRVAGVVEHGRQETLAGAQFGHPALPL